MVKSESKLAGINNYTALQKETWMLRKDASIPIPE